MHRKLLLPAAVVLLFLPGCFPETSREETPSLETDREEVLFRSGTGEGWVKDTLYVSSNRSWTVFSQEDTDWISFAEEGFENPSGVRKTTPLVVICLENPADDERSSSIRIVGGGQQKQVTIRQEGMSRKDCVEAIEIGDHYFEDHGTD